MQNLVDYIRPDCSIVLLDGQLLTSDKIEECKKYYKKEIFEKLGGETVGKVALIWTNDMDVILPALKALWELGVAISVHDFNLRVITHPMFKNFYSHIDLVIGHENNGSVANTVLSHVPHVNQLINPTVYVFSENDTSNKVVPNKPITEETVCCVTHTSGTTGEPKIIKTTHKIAIELVKENIKLFEFNDQDKVLHHKTLHHGSLFLNYAIPAFCTTDKHYWISSDSKKGWSNFLQDCIVNCQNEKITKWLLPYRLISDLADDSLPAADLSSTSLITVVGPSQPVMQKIFDKYNPSSVYNNFGCTEIGTLAISKTTKNNIKEYKPNRFTILNKLVDLIIYDSFFKCKFKNDNNWQSIGDHVSIVDGVFFWHGRNNSLTFGQHKITLWILQQWIEKYLNTNYFSLVADFDLNCLYLAIFDKSLNHVTIEDINYELGHADQFKNCFLSKLEFIDFEAVAMGVKPSQPVLLWYFRGLKT